MFLDGEVVFSLGVMINKEKTKLLFAETSSNFADVLLSFLTLPLGKFVRLLQKHYGDETPTMGSLNSLYYGIKNLNDVHFWKEGGKKMLLNPTTSFEAECRKLKIYVYDSNQPTEYHTCGDRDCKRKTTPSVSIYYDTRKCQCGKLLNEAMGVEDSETLGDDGIFTKKSLTFLITDDLRMVPDVLGSCEQTLSNLGITVTDGAEMRTISVGLNKIMDLLKLSLLSKTPLIDFVIDESHRTHYVTRYPLHPVVKKEPISDTEKIIVIAWLQKTTQELLFVEANKDFVDFLCSLLVIPLGGAEWLLDSNTSVGSMDNLYRSIANLGKYLRSPDTKNRLMKPELPPMYLSRNHIFPLIEQKTPRLCYSEVTTDTLHGEKVKGCWTKGKGSYVKKPGKFMVKDDLTVMPLYVKEIISLLHGWKIPLSDVEEMEIHIGLEEALEILKASLTSSSALTISLIDPILNKQQEDQ